MAESSGEIQGDGVCPNCGSPSFAGHMKGCGDKSPAVVEPVELSSESERRLGLLLIQEKITDGAAPDEIEVALPTKVKEYADQARMNRVIEKYRQSFEVVAKYRDMGLDAGQMFAAIFGFEPRGKVDLLDGKIDLTWVCDEIEDFQKVLGGYAKKMKEQGVMTTSDQKDMANFEWSGGAVVSDTDMLTDPSLAGRAVVISRTGAELNREYLGDVTAHEKQHVVNNLYENARPYHANPILLSELGKLPSEEQKDALMSYLRHERQAEVDGRIQDELLAHYKGLDVRDEGEGARKIGANLAISYLEKFTQDSLSVIKGDLRGARIETALATGALNQVFKSEVRDVISGAIRSLLELQKKGFTKDQAINLVQLDHIVDWPELVSKL